MNKVIVLLSLMFNVSGLNAQRYTDYYNLINQAEEKFVTERDTSCYPYFDLAFDQFDPFLKDLYIASQIALSLEDTSKFYSYLAYLF